MSPTVGSVMPYLLTFEKSISKQKSKFTQNIFQFNSNLFTHIPIYKMYMFMHPYR